jgi:hypothetical protein
MDTENVIDTSKAIQVIAMTIKKIFSDPMVLIYARKEKINTYKWKALCMANLRITICTM